MTIRTGTRRILIVDDEAAIRRMLDLYFTSAGFDVRTAANGEEALLMGQTEQFDVLLSDVLMPGINGHEVVQWFQAWSPHTRTVLMSGFDDIRCCGRSQCNSSLQKPFRPYEAVSTIERILATQAN
jgi:DNA-binding NtrC family response regulator